jgi:hypothetical protein
MRDPCIYTEVTKKTSEILEQVDKCFEAGCDAFGSLVHLVTKIVTYGPENGTYRKQDCDAGKYCFRGCVLLQKSVSDVDNPSSLVDVLSCPHHQGWSKKE